MEVTAIVPVWNRADLLEKLFDSLDAQTAPPAVVIVVDNGSTDGAAELAERRGARVIRMGSNRGFAAAVNCGIREVRTGAIAILNNDVVLDANWLGALTAALDDAQVWFACGKLLDARDPRRIDGLFDAVCRGGTACRIGHGGIDTCEPSRAIAMTSATAAVFRTELFHKAGPLDEGFVSYLEDVDFGLRCAVGGYAGRYIAEAIARHEGSATLGRWNAGVVRAIARNQIVLVAKHYPSPLLWRYGWCILVAHGLWGLVALRHGAFVPWGQGVIEGLRRAWRTRRPTAESTAALRRALTQGEREILRAPAGVYWKLYSFLTGGGAK